MQSQTTHWTDPTDDPLGNLRPNIIELLQLLQAEVLTRDEVREALPEYVKSAAGISN